MERHNMVYPADEVGNMTNNQWKKLIDREFGENVKKVITMKRTQLKKVQRLIQESGKLKKYFTQLTWEAARTVFEVRTNMIKIDTNFGHQENNCCMCGQKSQQSTCLNEKEVNDHNSLHIHIMK